MLLEFAGHSLLVSEFGRTTIGGAPTPRFRNRREIGSIIKWGDLIVVTRSSVDIGLEIDL